MSNSQNKQELHPPAKKWKPHRGPKPVSYKSKEKEGLGRLLINEKKKTLRGTKDPNSFENSNLGKNKGLILKSVVEENPLDEFLNTAVLEDRDFTAERDSFKIISIDEQQSNIEAKRKKKEEEQIENEKFLTIPRKPNWSSKQSKIEVKKNENLKFSEWRKSLSRLKTSYFVLTPYEKNINVWRQLWNVIERSSLIVQVLDSRNPLFYFSKDLEHYVEELSTLENPKKTLLLVNKADFLTEAQRRDWANFFETIGRSFVFYSASYSASQSITKENDNNFNKDEQKNLLKILSVEELIARFKSECPLNEHNSDSDNLKYYVGLVGYPNVGKSSTINSLIGIKKVSISATPGKTKHFQTINLTLDVVLCDCPGLVFPNFSNSIAELVCNSVLPIDQIKDYMSPITLVCERIPTYFLEAYYGIKYFDNYPTDKSNKLFSSPPEFIHLYSKLKGYMKESFGNYDESRSSRLVLKDYINGKLLFVHPPPKILDKNTWILLSLEESREFNKNNFVLSMLNESRKQKILKLISTISEISENDDSLNLNILLDDRISQLKKKNPPDSDEKMHFDNFDQQFFLDKGIEKSIILPFHRKVFIDDKKHKLKKKIKINRKS